MTHVAGLLRDAAPLCTQWSSHACALPRMWLFVSHCLPRFPLLTRHPLLASASLAHHPLLSPPCPHFRGLLTPCRGTTQVGCTEALAEELMRYPVLKLLHLNKRTNELERMPVHELTHFNLDRRMGEQAARAVLYSLPDAFTRDQQVTSVTPSHRRTVTPSHRRTVISQGCLHQGSACGHS